MPKYTLLVFLGIFIAILPHLGLPNATDTVVFSVAGVLVVLLALAARFEYVRRMSAMREMPKEKVPAFSESMPPPPRPRRPRRAPQVSPQVDVIPPSSTFFTP